MFRVMVVGHMEMLGWQKNFQLCLSKLMDTCVKIKKKLSRESLSTYLTY